MNSNILVSLVVPVYKVERYLEKCVQSLVNQTYKNIEIILVDDGSPDSSGNLCDSFALKDDRIRVYHKSNGGLSDARNYGMDKAKGDYILFIDSDDFIEINAVEILLKKAIKDNLDIVAGEATVLSEDLSIISTISISPHLTDCATGLQYFELLLQDDNYSAAVWLRMYRMDLLKQNNLRFKVGIYHEDEQWTPYVLIKAQKVGFVRLKFYNYIIHTGSITQRSNRNKHIHDVMNTCIELSENILPNTNGSLKRYFSDYVSRLYMSTVSYGDFDRKYYKKIANRNFPLKNAKKLKTIIKSVIYSISYPLYRNLRMSSGNMSN